MLAIELNGSNAGCFDAV